MKGICLLCAGLIALLFASHWTQDVAGDVYALPDGLTQLKGQSYWLKSKIVTLVGGKPSILECDEYFSSWQRRSRIDYRVIKGNYARDWLEDDKIPSEGTVLADDRNVLLVGGRATGATCSRISLKLATKMFTMGAFGPDDERKQPPNLIGPSRLLHFIADIVYKLTLVDDGKSPAHQTFRTIPNMVELTYSLPDGGSMVLFYSNNQADNLAHGVPREMHLKFAERKMVIYEFQEVTLLNDYNFIDRQASLIDARRLQSQHTTIHPDVNSLTFDLFSWRRGGGCSKVLRKSQLDDRLDLVGLDRQEYRFSFTARPNDWNPEDSSEMIVAYEPTISTLRLNKISPLETTESTINYRQMRGYHVLKKHNNNFNEFETAFSDSPVPEGGKNSEVRDGGKISCVKTPVTVVSARDPLSRGLKLGDMLLGSIKFTYLGRAKVRGIDALMFESPESEWPIWLESPALIYKSSGLKSTDRVQQTLSRPAGGFIDESGYRLNTVIYLSASTIGGQNQSEGKSDYQEPIGLGSKLLLMEFHELHKKSNELLRTSSVSIYDFAWHIVSGGIGNQPYIDFFAIADECPRDDDGVREQARVDLILAIKHQAGNGNQGVSKFDGSSEGGMGDGWLLDDIKRSLAIMQAMHYNAKIPSSSVYDFESRLRSDASTTGGEETEVIRVADGTQVAVSFQMVNHVRHLDELIFLGIGCVKPNSTTKFRRFPLKFGDCSLMAAHQKLETIFGFDPILNSCHVYMKKVTGPTLALLFGSTIDMNKADCSPKLEIYRTTRRLDGIDISSKFKFDSPQKIGLFPVLDDGHEDARSGDPVWYNAEALKTRVSHPSRATTSSVSLDSESRRLPFGLVSTNPMNTLVAPNQRDDESSDKVKSWAETHLRRPINELTFGLCQAECLVTQECDAFSICQRGGRVECVLTRANLRSEASLRRLNEVAFDKSIRTGQVFEIDITQESNSGDQMDYKSRVALRKHPACELHFKDYMALTQRRNVARVMWAHDLARLKPVQDREECARRCLQRTIDTLREEVKPLSELSADAMRRLDEGGKNLRDLYQQHRATHLKVCSTFLYLDVESCDAKLVERLHEAHSETVSNETNWGGFCSIAGEQIPSERREMDMVGSEVVSEKHQMDFSMMYEKHFGLSLLESNLTADEKTALNAVVHSGDDPLTPSDLKVLEAFVERGENHVHYFYTSDDVAGCAKACLLAQPVWPACKSFSVEAFSPGTGPAHFTCRLNSVSLSEVLANERYDLILEQKSPTELQRDNTKDNVTVLYWHYELRSSLVGHSVEWAARLQAEYDLWGVPEHPAGKSTVHLSSLWFLACIFLILVFGTKLGVYLGKKFIMHLDTLPEDGENLVNGISLDHPDPLTSGVPIEFKSLATCYEEPENEAKAEQEREFDS